MDKQIFDMSPQELDSYLMDRYGFGLHQFAIILCRIIRTGDSYRGDSLPSYQAMREYSSKIQNMKNKIMDTLIEGRGLVGPLRGITKSNMGKKTKRRVHQSIIEGYKLKGFFDQIDRTNESFERLIKKKARGIPTKKRNLIASLWGLLIRDEKNKIDWDLISKILDWFWEILKPYNCYSEFNPGNLSIDLNYLKNQFYRNKERCVSLVEKDRCLSEANNVAVLDIYGPLNLSHRTVKMWVAYVVNDSRSEPFCLEGLYAIRNFYERYKAEITPRVLFMPAIEAYIVRYITELTIENPPNPPKIIFPDLSYL